MTDWRPPLNDPDWIPRRPEVVVAAQAEDAALWAVSDTMVEAYLQQELRELHYAIEWWEARIAKQPICAACGEPEPIYTIID